MAIQTLTQVDVVGRPELERFIHMLRHTSDGLTPQWMELLLKNVSDSTPLKKDVAIKSSLLQSLIELAVADGDLALAQVHNQPYTTLLSQPYSTLLLQKQIFYFNDHSCFLHRIPDGNTHSLDRPCLRPKSHLDHLQCVVAGTRSHSTR